MNNLAVALMIKDESRVIERCLESLLQLKPYKVIIMDTGSTDDTVVKAGLFLQNNNIPFKIYSRPFIDFGTNRTQLLDLVLKDTESRSRKNYTLMMDADDIVHYDKDFDADIFKQSLAYMVHQIVFVSGNLTFYLPKITNNLHQFSYKGVTHEYLDVPYLSEQNSLKICEKVRIIQLNDGNRRVNNNKTKQDVDLLEKGLKDTEDEFLKSRYTFYLAQSYYDLGDYANAIIYYNNRIRMGGWNEEIFYSYYQLGNISVKTNPTDLEPILKFYLLAFSITRNRIEPLVALKNSLISNDQEFLAETIIQPVINNIKQIPIGLFVENDKYVKSS